MQKVQEERIHLLDFFPFMPTFCPFPFHLRVSKEPCLSRLFSFHILTLCRSFPKTCFLTLLITCLFQPLDTHVRLRGGDSASPWANRKFSKLDLSRLCLVSRSFDQVVSAKLFRHWLVVIDKPSELEEVVKATVSCRTLPSFC